MGNETYIKKINNLLSKKTYHYESEIYSFDYVLELTGEIKPLISIGEWKDFYLLNFKRKSLCFYAISSNSSPT